MKQLVDKIKVLPIAVKVGEVLLIISVLILFFMIVGGGSFTTYYAMMGVLGMGVVSAVIALINKRIGLVLIDLLGAGGLFLVYLSIA